LLGLGTAGLDIDGSVVTNIGGTIQANAGSFVYLEDGTKIIGGRLNTTANGDIVVKNAIFDGGGTHPITNDGNLEIQPPSSAEGLFTQGVIINHCGISLPSGAGLFLGLPSSPGMDTTLKGGGEVALNNSAIHLCPTTTLSKPLTLNNVDNIISGYGAIGGTTPGSSLVLNNEPLGINANINNQALTTAMSSIRICWRRPAAASWLSSVSLTWWPMRPAPSRPTPDPSWISSPQSKVAGWKVPAI
jgi:hypothetical protein